MVAALSWAARLKNGLARTREVLNTPVAELFARRRVDESLFEDLETALLQADCGVPATRRSSNRDSSTDRKSTRLNSSHQIISYAVFCLKKKNSAIRLT